MLIDIVKTSLLLKGKDKILILMHASPDGDTIGSGHALYYALKNAGKKVCVRCADEIPKRYSYITSSVEDCDFDPEYIVAVDVADTFLLGKSFQNYADKIDLAIDHHKSNTGYAKMTCLYPQASSTCEIITDIINEMGLVITKLIADCLYTGLATDTGCFKYSCTGKHAHIIAAQLISCGADYADINREMFDTKTRGRIQVEQAVLNGLKYFADGKIAVISLSRQLLENANVSEDELDGLSSIPRSIEGVEIGIMLREKSENHYKISVRTTKYVDASKLCAVFGGGGHEKAAGCTIDGALEEITEKLVKEAEKLLC